MEQGTRMGGRSMSRVKWGAVSAFLWIAALAGCTPREGQRNFDEVTVQLKWVHQAQFAGFYWAQEKGYYARENLKVHFREGGQGIDSAQSVISGEAAFGVITPEDVLIKRSQGAPLTAIAAHLSPQRRGLGRAIRLRDYPPG